jgi:hypothetical protein
MTVSVVHADTGSTRQGWRSLLWLAPLTALWVVLTYWQPGIQASGVPNLASRLFIHVLTMLGLWLGLERTAMTPSQRRNVWLAVMIPYTLWLAVAWNLGAYGVFQAGGRVPRLPLAIFLPVIIGTPFLLLSKRLGEALDAMPATWLVALQVYRVLGAVFLVNWARGAAPGIFALPAGVGDVITGLLAVPAAIALGTGSAEGRRAAIAWNLFGLTDFAVAISIGLITAPGPFQLIVPSIPNASAVTYPAVMIPAFGVPSSILLHVLSLRQLYRQSSLVPRSREA